MPFNGSGAFSLVSGNPVVTGTVISSTWANNTLNDLSTGLSTTITKDGQTTPTANIPMGGYKITGLGAATGNGEAVRYEQVASLVQAQTGVYFTTAGTTTAYTLTPTPALTSLLAGQRFNVVFNAANTTASTTLAISGLTAKTLKYYSATGVKTDPPIGGLAINMAADIVYDGTDYVLLSLGTGKASSGDNTDITFLGNNSSTIYTTAGTSTAYTITPTPAITAYAIGQSFFVNFNAACGAAPTFQISAIATPPNLVKENQDGTFSNLAANDIPINHRSRVTLISTTQALVEKMPNKIAQSVITSSGAYATGGTTIPFDNTKPQVTEGDQYLSRGITPTNAASTLVIEGLVFLGHSVGTATLVSALFKDGAADSLAAGVSQTVNVGGCMPVPFRYEMVAGSTSAMTFTLRAGSGSAGSTYFNGVSGAGLMDGVLTSYLKITEYLP